MAAEKLTPSGALVRTFIILPSLAAIMYGTGSTALQDFGFLPRTEDSLLNMSEADYLTQGTMFGLATALCALIFYRMSRRLLKSLPRAKKRH